jgi:uncharacterized protein YbaR (Trm112 family)
MDRRLLEVLVCPVCKGPLTWDAPRLELVCRAERLGFPVRDSIPVLLADEARTVPSDELP